MPYPRRISSQLHVAEARGAVEEVIFVTGSELMVSPPRAHYLLCTTSAQCITSRYLQILLRSLCWEWWDV